MGVFTLRFSSDQKYTFDVNLPNVPTCNTLVDISVHILDLFQVKLNLKILSRSTTNGLQTVTGISLLDQTKSSSKYIIYRCLIVGISLYMSASTGLQRYLYGLEELI